MHSSVSRQKLKAKYITVIADEPQCNCNMCNVLCTKCPSVISYSTKSQPLDVFRLIKAFFEGHISDPLSTHLGKRGTKAHLMILVAVLTSD